MPVAPFTKFYSFTEAVCEKAHNLGADSLKVMLVNSASTGADQHQEKRPNRGLRQATDTRLAV